MSAAAEDGGAPTASIGMKEARSLVTFALTTRSTRNQRTSGEAAVGHQVPVAVGVREGYRVDLSGSGLPVPIEVRQGQDPHLAERLFERAFGTGRCPGLANVDQIRSVRASWRDELDTGHLPYRAAHGGRRT
nr:hypothetical protein [Spiractinospora alimapuensis]